jgi:hypothetical protein
MHELSPALLNDAEGPMQMSNSNQLPGTFTSNLVGGRRVSRRKIRKIYRSYKKSNSSRGKTIKQRLRSLKEGVLSRLFNKSKKHSRMHRHGKKRCNKRHLQRGGSHDSAFLNRALASPNESLQGMLSSCVV